ncbi:hypothetical protein MSG28_005397 [Choristoneura fumiferana]|uniref:Uncharacterized protein n=1 Tax=Choristoneura fumiferana TaxID=7141 RepID=A0ACC0JRJ1_CHOFU|nr:hypothetical protein MSG28_005397 [Choristoneura fumiferana]
MSRSRLSRLTSIDPEDRLAKNSQRAAFGWGRRRLARGYRSGMLQGFCSKVGILDADICGPSQPRVLGVRGEQVHNSGSGWSPVYVSDNLSLMSIGFLLGSPDDAVIWRGPKKNGMPPSPHLQVHYTCRWYLVQGMIKQFLSEVDWGDLDYLLIDTPPGKVINRNR